VWARIANAKSFGWAIYAAGFAIWLFGYLSAGHAPLFDWNAATPWWVSSFVPNFEAELGLALMCASMIPIYGGAVRVRLHSPSSLRGRDPRVVVVFGVAILECDLIFSAGGDGGGKSA
jgi:hypothetical protein